MSINKYKILLIIIVSGAFIRYSYSQELSFRDTIRVDIPLNINKDSVKSRGLYLKLPRFNPVDNLQPQFSPFDRHFVLPQYSSQNTGILPIQWDGVSSNFINSKSSTAIARTVLFERLFIYSTATLGIIETPFFGKSDFFILSAGANYAISNEANIGVRGGYNSDYGFIPTWNTGIDLNVMVNPNLMIDGGLTYMSTSSNSFGVQQSTLLIDLHGRYRITDDWFVNAYGGAPINQKKNNSNHSMLPAMNTPYFGGTVEHWFKPTVGVEGGMIWSRDMFSGKMRPRPKIELLFRPGR